MLERAPLIRRRTAVETLQLDPVLTQRLEADDRVWTSDRPMDDILAVVAHVGPYSRRRKLIDNQVIDWIPQQRVNAPMGLFTQSKRVLQDFLAGTGSQDGPAARDKGAAPGDRT
jgi:hypothetical protein